MPRKNRTPKHIPFKQTFSSSGKTRYKSKKAAESAAEHIMLMDMKVEISVYQDTDGGWYLTSKKD